MQRIFHRDQIQNSIVICAKILNNSMWITFLRHHAHELQKGPVFMAHPVY